MQPNESLYDQKPEEPPVLVPSSDSANSTPKSFATRFQYIDNPQPADNSSGGARVHSRVSPLKSSNLFAEYEMDSCLSKETSSTMPEVQASIERVCVYIYVCVYTHTHTPKCLCSRETLILVCDNKTIYQVVNTVKFENMNLKEGSSVSIQVFE